MIFWLVSFTGLFLGQHLLLGNNAVFLKVHGFVMFSVQIYVLRSVDVECKEVHKGEISSVY